MNTPVTAPVAMPTNPIEMEKLLNALDKAAKATSELAQLGINGAKLVGLFGTIPIPLLKIDPPTIGIGHPTWTGETQGQVETHYTAEFGGCVLTWSIAHPAKSTHHRRH